ncbi:MAG: transglycosylase domain-containing protein, partial [Bacteroidota bacterium]
FYGPLPTYSDLRAVQNDEASEVYGTREVLLGKYFVQNRVNANLEELSPYLINALVATEDARFFQHSGIDPRALVRVIIRTILLGDEGGGGGSTLSQQLAKNLFDREEYGLLTIPVVKIREMIIARRLENIYSKEELLRLYLNTVPFSDNVYGVKVAAQRFFNRSVADLQVEEAALLIGTLKGNSMYSPIRYPQRATQRRNVVLGQMEKYGYLDSLSTDSLQAQPIQLAYQSEGNNQGLATYFREHLRLELADILDTLKKADGGNYNLYTDGLKIFTTIDPRLQGYAEEAVSEHMADLQKAFDDHWKSKRPYSRK